MHYDKSSTDDEKLIVLNALKVKTSIILRKNTKKHLFYFRKTYLDAFVII